MHYYGDGRKKCANSQNGLFFDFILDSITQARNIFRTI